MIWFLVYNKQGGHTEHADTVSDANFSLRPWHYKYPTVYCRGVKNLFGLGFHDKRRSPFSQSSPKNPMQLHLNPASSCTHSPPFLQGLFAQWSTKVICQNDQLKKSCLSVPLKSVACHLRIMRIKSKIKGRGAAQMSWKKLPVKLLSIW